LLWSILERSNGIDLRDFLEFAEIFLTMMFKPAADAAISMRAAVQKSATVTAR